MAIYTKQRLIVSASDMAEAHKNAAVSNERALCDGYINGAVPFFTHVLDAIAVADLLSETYPDLTFVVMPYRDMCFYLVII